MNPVPGPSIEEVFPSAGTPQYTYRKRAKYEHALDRYARQGTGLLSVYGPTKAGKSVLVTKIVKGALYIRGDVETASLLWERASTELGTFTQRANSKARGSSMGVSLAVGLRALWAKISGRADLSTSRRDEVSRSATDDIQTVVLNRALKTKTVIVIDDFHFMPRPEQRKVMAALKGFIDRSGRAIVITAAHRAQYVGSLIPNASGRVAQLEVEPWDVVDLEAIATVGFAKLNVTDPHNLGRTLAEGSFGSPQLMQRLCKQLCITNEVWDHESTPKQLDPPADWANFYRGLLDRNDPEVRWVDRLTRGPQERRARNTYATIDGGRADGYGLIMSALVSLLPEMTIKREAITEAISQMTSGPSGPRTTETSTKLTYLSKLAARPLDDPQKSEDELKNDDTETDVEPVLEYQEAGPNSVLRIVDPLFAFALRWWGTRK